MALIAYGNPIPVRLQVELSDNPTVSKMHSIPVRVIINGDGTRQTVRRRPRAARRRCAPERCATRSTSSQPSSTHRTRRASPPTWTEETSRPDFRKCMTSTTTSRRPPTPRPATRHCVASGLECKPPTRSPRTYPEPCTQCEGSASWPSPKKTGGARHVVAQPRHGVRRPRADPNRAAMRRDPKHATPQTTRCSHTSPRSMYWSKPASPHRPIRPEWDPAVGDATPTQTPPTAPRVSDRFRAGSGFSADDCFT